MPLDPNPKSMPVALPNWGTFRVAMLTNQAYARVIAASANQRAVSRVESYFATEVENWPIAASLWQQMMTGCPIESKPKPEEAAGWTAIAQQTSMPFSFSASGDFQVKA